MELIGVDRSGPIEAWVPMFLFAIVFGLSMDYEVFLLSRIKEEYDRTRDNETAVADGLAATARVITAAALIMFCVFGAFVLGDDRQLKLFGLGLAIAVLIDATDRPHGPRAGDDGAARRSQLVAAQVARPDPAEDQRRRRAPHRSRSQRPSSEGRRPRARARLTPHPTPQFLSVAIGSRWPVATDRTGWSVDQSR